MPTRCRSRPARARSTRPAPPPVGGTPHPRPTLHPHLTPSPPLPSPLPQVDALRVLGVLYAQRPDTSDKALERLSRAAELSPNDVDVWLEVGKLQQTRDLAAALKAYEKAAAVLERSQRAVPVELWNNLGAIRHRLGKLESAEEAYRRALRVSGRGGHDVGVRLDQRHRDVQPRAAARGARPRLRG